MGNIKKLAAAFAMSGVLLAGVVTPALADGGGYGSQPGFTTSLSHTVCAGHGAFGAFSGTANDGQQGSAVHGLVLADKAAGISLGSETGPANSDLCGNPQGQP